MRKCGKKMNNKTTEDISAEIKNKNFYGIITVVIIALFGFSIIYFTALQHTK